MRAGRLATFAGEYLSALGARRTIRRLQPMSDEDALAFARTFCWRGDHIQPSQGDEEILWLMSKVHGLGARVIVEIGADKGGTLFLWSRAAAADARLVAVDTRPLGRLGDLSTYALVRRGFARERQHVELLFGRDSHDPDTVSALRRVTAGSPVDFLFIDGDHTYEGVKRDFELYAPLVRPGGLVAFHDIVATDAPGVVRFWTELADAHETEQLVASSYGIGVVHVGEMARTTA